MKTLKKVLGWLVSPLALGLVVTTCAAYIAMMYYSHYQDTAYDGESRFFDFIREVHQKSVDFRMLDRGPTQGHPDVAIIGIDEPSIEQEGRWPWPREKIGRLVERTIEKYGAKTIAFDIIFSEEDSNSSRPTLARLKRIFGEKPALSSEVQTTISAEMDKADSDGHFAETIKKYADHLVMGSYFEELDKSDLERVSQHYDECVDVVHERTPEYRYWSNDQRKPNVTDYLSVNRELPAPMKEHLSQYLMILEASEIDSFMVEQPNIATDLAKALEAIGIPDGFPLPPLLFGFLNQDRDLIASSIEQIMQVKPQPGQVEGVLETIASVIKVKDQAILQRRLRATDASYCQRFLTENQAHPEGNDELLVKASFDQRYQNGDFKGQFDALSWNSVWATAASEKAQLPFPTFPEYLDKLRSTALRNQISPISKWWVNIPVLGQATKYSAYFNAFLDTDGTIRKNMFLARRGNTYASSLALSAFLVSQNYNVVAQVTQLSGDKTRKGVPLQFTTSENKSATAGFRIMDKDANLVMPIPIDAAGRMAINYSGKSHTFPHIGAADLLSDNPKATIKWRHKDPKTGIELLEETVDKAQFLKNKILIIGATAVGIFDLRVTPFEENFPGVETHANMLSNLLVERDRATGNSAKVSGLPGFLRSYPQQEESIMICTLIGLGILLSFLLSYFGSVAGLLITAVAATSIYAIDKYVLFNSGVVVTVIFPMSLIFSIFVTLTFYKYFTEERTKRELKGTFEKYVSPAIVNEVLSDPSNIELGGKKMELTVMFSDVRGFTTISEKLDPRALSDLLNSYLTPMTNLVFEHKGTLDKYMGDAIMAFWGAPIHFKDHAKHACRCALKMIDKLKELQAEYRAKGLPEIDIGIGLNTGEMSVGNMGSDTVRSYTVMGDAVNLGSRLEGINKQYGTRIIISEFTYNAVKDSFICREVDWVRVKGKAQPVRIFELISEKVAAPETAKVINLFGEGFTAYHSRDWNTAIAHFTAALNLKPDDEPSSLYLERCQEYVANPPPDDWDGVFTMTTK